MLGLWILAGAALAGPFRFAPSPGVAPTVLPVVEPGRAEILLRGNRADIRRQLGREAREGLRAWRVSDLGESWVVTVWLESPSDTFSLRQDGEAWVGVVSPADPGTQPALSLERPPSVEALLALPPGTGACGEEAASALVPLHGADMLHAFRPSDFVPQLPRWTDAEIREASWEGVGDLQGDLLLARTPPERALRLYALGAAYRDLGHEREAAYYFGRADAAGAPDGAAAIQRAGALLRSRQWEAAREAAVQAVKGGAAEESALEVVAVTALHGGLSVAPVARSLALRTTVPQAQLVAGALLLRDRCAAESSVLLRRARTGLAPGKDPESGKATGDPARHEMATILLADALVLLGESRGAAEVLGELDGVTTERWRPLARARGRLLSMLAVTPDQWPTFVPSLSKAADTWDVEGTESLYLLGQVGAALGDSRMANDAFAALISRERSLAEGGPGRRLFRSWGERLGELFEAGRALDALAFHGGTWRSALITHAQDPLLLRRVAAAQVDAGLFESALATLSEIASFEGARNLDDRETALAIADVYRRSGRLTEAVDALSYLARRSSDPSLTPRAQLLLARTHDDAGDEDSARATYARLLRRGAAPGPVRAEARLRAALLDARVGRCAEALPALLPGTLPPDVSPGLLGVSRAKCLRAAGRTEEARAAAVAAAPLLTDPEVIAWASFLGSVGVPVPASRPASGADPAAATTTADDPAAAPASSPGRVWRWLLDEDAAHQRMRARVKATASPPRAPPQ
jgi:tetratricopeptide (TPR) repeat protein